MEQIPLHAELSDDLYDLIVVSEILYYLSAEDLTRVLAGLLARLLTGGDVVAVHHRACDRCYGYDGFNVHSALTTRPERSLVHHDDENFVLDVLRRQ